MCVCLSFTAENKTHVNSIITPDSSVVRVCCRPAQLSLQVAAGLRGHCLRQQERHQCSHGGLDDLSSITHNKYDTQRDRGVSTGVLTGVLCLCAEVVRAMTFVIDQGMAMYWGTSRWNAVEIMVNSPTSARRSNNSSLFASFNYIFPFCLPVWLSGGLLHSTTV